MTHPDKTCVVCGRAIQWRSKWAKNWEQVKYCSTRCRSNKLTEVDRQIEETIETLLGLRRPGATICPSEVARELFEDWKPRMEQVRQAGRRLVARGRIEITQRGRVVDPSTAKGPIRFKRVR